MTSDAPPLRTDSTPCLLFPQMIPHGGGLTRSLQERANLYARRWERVLILTTGFQPRWEQVVAELKLSGKLDERVEVRNFFAHSQWVRELGVPPVPGPDADDAVDADGLVTKRQRYGDGPVFRLADYRPGVSRPSQFRYFDRQGRLFLTTGANPDSKHERRAVALDGTSVSWPAIVAAWVDDEIADLPSPVLFAMQRGLNDPVLLESRNAARKIASLHNCHLVDPADPASGIKPSYRTLLSNTAEVDAIVCQTRQQERELRPEVPLAALSSIGYPGRPVEHLDVEKDPSLVVLVGQLIERKRVDHAVRAFATVHAAVPDARLEVYGDGPLRDELQALITSLGLDDVVTLMGYSLDVGRAQARAACALIMSTFEGSPRVVTESMSRGTPVIAYTLRYGPRDLIRDGVDGILLETHTPDALADAIVSMLRDPDGTREMGRRAAEIVQTRPVAAFEQAWWDLMTVPLPTPPLSARLTELQRRARRRLRKTAPGKRLSRLRRLATARLTAPQGSRRPGGSSATRKRSGQSAR